MTSTLFVFWFLLPYESYIKSILVLTSAKVSKTEGKNYGINQNDLIC